ncbi:MAG: hypothetical protein ACRDMX_09685 [Solirubrobacteraceae bacterium]
MEASAFPEGSASAPTHPALEAEPADWQPRALHVGARGLAGGGAFFFISFVFSYFYLKSQDVNHDWKIGHVHPGIGLGIAILVCLIAAAVLLRTAVERPVLTVAAGGWALALAFAAVVLQVIEWTTLGFGPASGGYASVYVGWTIFYSLAVLFCCYWIETQVATAWRLRRLARIPATPDHVTTDPIVIQSGLNACSFFWNFMTLNGIVLFVLLYAIG